MPSPKTRGKSRQKPVPTAIRQIVSINRGIIPNQIDSSRFYNGSASPDLQLWSKIIMGLKFASFVEMVH